MMFDEIPASDLEKIAASLPSAYSFIVDGNFVWIYPGDPQYQEAKAAYENHVIRGFRA